ncbi:hypothetical protein ARMGADRAFT_465304 [Armillaria gallica]|uniref:Uncharacterized protein n=1 Tax=Armillaria gallica TaxID=47427 RepID=A0A2H3DDZ4_ARMGA|nr:hypothetical protein ARMGADRAFT_465304 [Armillaria gallica]
MQKYPPGMNFAKRSALEGCPSATEELGQMVLRGTSIWPHLIAVVKHHLRILPSISTLYDPTKVTLYNPFFRTINICLDSPVRLRVVHNPMSSLFSVIYSQQVDDLDNSNVWPIVHGISDIISKIRMFTGFIEGIMTIPLARNVIHLWVKTNECYVPDQTHYRIRDLYDVVVGVSDPVTRLFTKTISTIPRAVALHFACHRPNPKPRFLCARIRRSLYVPLPLHLLHTSHERHLLCQSIYLLDVLPLLSDFPAFGL